MRALLLLALVSGASVLQGCTALGAGVALELNRQHRADATTTGPDTATVSPVPGDTLTLRLADGRGVRGAFVSLSDDSLALDTGTFALADVERVVRPWRRGKVGVGVALGALADVAFFWYIFHGLTYDFSGLAFD